MPTTATPTRHPGPCRPSATSPTPALLWAVALLAVLTLLAVTGLAVAAVRAAG